MIDEMIERDAARWISEALANDPPLTEADRLTEAEEHQAESIAAIMALGGMFSHPELS